ncbi:MAG: ribosomal RNA small subunit methyltransferase A [Oscillospiraceae bacterium]|nr:ribosomal RNA small subunit methyltransferase A [Oscillospiraceae bacterium]
MDLCDRRTIEELLTRHGFRFAKSMGQNFLIEGWVPRDTAEVCGADENCGVLEIGPGIGPLTQQLCRRAAKVVSIELDERLYDVLGETMGEFDNFTLVKGDAMAVDFPALVAQHFGGLRPLLCANLPYNITTPVLEKCILSRCFDSITVLIQKEAAERICAKAGSPDYSVFSLQMQYYTDPQIMFEVEPECFFPAPKVTSAVLHCPVRKTPPVEVVSEQALWRTVKGGFALRRKTLANSLQSAYPFSKEQLTEVIVSCGLAPTVRGEKLTLEDYARLTNALAALG